MIILEQITLEGYGSMVQKTIFPLKYSGLSILRGRVGSGKTTIPSALTWVLFGTTLKKGSTVETWEKIRPKDYRGTMVRVDFTKGSSKYSVIRCISYKGNILPKIKGGSKLMVLKDGEPIHDKRNKTDVQKEIIKILGYSYELFTNSIVFGQRLKRIIEESGPNKKKIFDEAFETLFIDKAKKQTEEDRNKIKQAKGDIITKIDTLNEKAEEAKDFYDDAIDFEKNFKKSKLLNQKKIQQSISELKGNNKKLSSKLEKVKYDNIESLIQRKQEEVGKLSKLEKKKIKLSTYQNKIDAKQNDVASSIKDVTKLSGNTCFTCGETIGKEKVEKLKSKLDKKIQKTKKKVIELKQKIKKLDVKGLNEQETKLKKSIQDISDTIASNKVNKKLAKEIQSSIDYNNERIEKLKNEHKENEKEKLVIKSVKYLEKANKYIKKANKLDKQKKSLEKQEELQNWLIKDPLSNSGLKAYIFDSLLGKVNERLWDYSDLIGFRIEFGIDLESGNKDFYQVILKEDNIINYPDLSGGQKQLVDTTVALAIHDVISSVRPMNLLFMDEPFEGLGEEEIEIVSDIITYKAKEQSLFLITHHNSFNPTGSNTIYFKLNKTGQTLIS